MATDVWQYLFSNNNNQLLGLCLLILILSLFENSTETFVPIVLYLPYCKTVHLLYSHFTIVNTLESLSIFLHTDHVFILYKMLFFI
jgi:hypothetical protein